MGDGNPLVSALLAQFPNIRIECIAKNGSARRPKWQTLSDEFRRDEEIHLMSQLTVVAFRCLFALREVCVELSFCAERKTVNAREHYIFLVASPIRSRNAVELERIRSDFFSWVFRVAALTEVHQSWRIVKSDFFTLA